MINILTIDVEEYFHPAEVEASRRMSEWSLLPSRVEAETSRLLDLLAERRVLATFFVVGWVAEQRPRLVRRIAEAGHEIGCHSYAHRLVYSQTPRAFREDTERAAAVISDACGVRPRLYRAPSYSIVKESLWALEILIECGFTHDSSIFPVVHDRYGIPGFGRFEQVLRTPAGVILEVPAATTRLASGAVVPVGGGGYLRLLPYRYTAAGIRRINSAEGQPACIYFHPWEIDPEQPRLASGFIARARTYTGLRGMAGKLGRLLADFQFSSMTRVCSGGASATPVVTILPEAATARV
jgi:polysaccharide deacetylase family protein (PEP-CTERM system associated)